MPTDTLSDDIALRIALAARTLPDTDPARLLRVLKEVAGLPPSAERLAELKVKDLKQAADGEFADLEPSLLKAALAILRGDNEIALTRPPPATEPYVEGEMPNSIRVACASDRGEELDGHFGAARRFLVYQVSALEHRLIDVRSIDETKPSDDKNADRAALIADCQVVYVASIGSPAAAKVVKKNIHPIKDDRGGSARDRMLALQRILSVKAPPWLAKAMGQTPEERVCFVREAVEA